MNEALAFLSFRYLFNSMIVLPELLKCDHKRNELLLLL